ncbi:MAG: hypothetical protein HPY45_11620 [Anaerolineae bacterium]|nr:hypothetical protein [Anaerolineae bacterium]
MEISSSTDTNPNRWHRRLSWSRVRFYLALALLDIISVGMGMGVPVFSIAFGLPAGWVIGQRVIRQNQSLSNHAGKALLAASMLALFTFIQMLIIWLPPTLKFFDPTFDVEGFGIPLWLYQPRVSYIGWMVLMILVSPALQASMFSLGVLASFWYTTLAKPKA